MVQIGEGGRVRKIFRFGIGRGQKSQLSPLVFANKGGPRLVFFATVSRHVAIFRGHIENASCMFLELYGPLVSGGQRSKSAEVKSGSSVIRSKDKSRVVQWLGCLALCQNFCGSIPVGSIIFP